MPEIIEKESWRLQFIPIVHMALWTTPGLTRGEAAWLHNLERRAMTRARHIVITGMPSLAHVRALTDDFDHNRVTRIPPGVDAVGWAALKGRPYGLPGAPAAGSRASDGPLHLLCVANLTWGKGYDVLLRALAQLADQEWTLTCVGSADRDPQYAASLKELAHTLGLERRIDWIGEVMGDPEGVSLRSADLFLLPTRGETYGMAVAEAIAHGLPVVSTRTGEIPSIVGEGGRLVEADDVEAFASAVRKVMSDAALRRQLAEGARAAATRLPTWEHAADAFDRVLSTVAR
jgi:glycosyltransferase involved in cell wall biosynthesis